MCWNDHILDVLIIHTIKIISFIVTYFSSLSFYKYDARKIKTIHVVHIIFLMDRVDVEHRSLKNYFYLSIYPKLDLWNSR